MAGQAGLVSGNREELLFVRNVAGEYRGWKRELLVAKLTEVEEKYLLCTVCQGLLRKACLFDDQGVQEIRCNLCLPENTAVDEAHMNQESVNERYVECPLKEKGCEWTDLITQVLPHIEECGFFPVQCPLGCVSEKEDTGSKTVEVERRFLEEHQKNQCPMRLINCDSCDSQIRVCEMNKHIEICEDCPILCPNSCIEGEDIQRVKRKHLPSHLEECSLQEVECPYAEHGCRDKMERRLVDQHEKQLFQKHLEFSMVNFKKQSQEIASLEKGNSDREREILRMEELQTSEMSRIKNELKCIILAGSLEWKIEGVKSKIHEDEETYSDIFCVGLYQLQCRIKWNSKGNGYLGCFLHIRKGDWDFRLTWPFRYLSRFVLVNQRDETQSYVKVVEITQEYMGLYTAFERPTQSRNNGFGMPNFISYSDLVMRDIYQNDSILLKICVERLPMY